MTLDDLLLLGEQMQRWQARIDNGEAGDWPHPETATFVRAALERIPALRAELAEEHEALTAARATLGRVEDWTHIHGAALSQYGEGKRDAKEEVARILLKEVSRG